ncbi:RNA polymerase sigma factor [Chitinophaga parva]|uniref:RNA polymerase sigma factor n=1 Tax=Chitinophaga parva TaxID=2169414 RepID=UPI0014030B92|nr:sigma-70 family RNA polymerase sigma factor [Chitinophaga parva]
MSKAPAHINEQILAARLLAGDPVARQYLYDKYAGAVYGIILQIVADRNKANDVLVRVFAYAFQHIHHFTNAGYHSLFAWLMKQAREISLRETSPSLSPGATVSQGLVLRNNHYIQRFTEGLPEHSSQVFRLCYYKGLSIQAVARMLGLPEETIKQSLSIAMIEFRKYLQSNWS